MIKRLIINQIILLTFQVILYFGCEFFQRNPHNVKREIDDKIPFLPETSLIYSLWFPLIAVFPIVLCLFDPFTYQRYMIIMALEIILSVICYLVYPTTFQRPVPPDTFWGRAMKLIYKGSYRGYNCAPSLHCSSCYLTIWMSIFCVGMPFQYRFFFAAIAAAIVVSTMTTKQHAVIDVTSALGLFLAAMLLGDLMLLYFA